MMAKVIIGLSGKAGTGKSEVAKYLIGRGFKLVKFAAPLKRMLKALGLTQEHIEGRLKEVPCDLLGGKTPREAMLTLGTEWGRNMIAGDLWVNAWKQTVEKMPTYVVTDDVRFPNEAKAVHGMGGVIAMIERDKQTKIDHESESYLISGDFVIHNIGTIDDLHSAADSVLNSILGQRHVA